jgi:hypothetical protein
MVAAVDGKGADGGCASMPRLANDLPALDCPSLRCRSGLVARGVDRAGGDAYFERAPGRMLRQRPFVKSVKALTLPAEPFRRDSRGLLMSFWDIIWFIFISFALVAYLMVMFSVIGDLFRDQSTSGVVKAVWIVLLIVAPLITSVVYLILRGARMAERNAAAAAAATADPGRGAETSSPVDQIAKARGLADSGAITEDEFDSLKAKVLA